MSVAVLSLLPRCLAAVISLLIPLLSARSKPPKIQQSQRVERDMELASELEIKSEQREEAEDPSREHPEQAPAPRGRPWVKGQSSNPPI
jgi:hypothetical protein